MHFTPRISDRSGMRICNTGASSRLASAEAARREKSGVLEMGSDKGYNFTADVQEDAKRLIGNSYARGGDSKAGAGHPCSSMGREAGSRNS
jgi:hypothetical protein